MYGELGEESCLLIAVQLRQSRCWIWKYLDISQQTKWNDQATETKSAINLTKRGYQVRSITEEKEINWQHITHRLLKLWIDSKNKNCISHFGTTSFDALSTPKFVTKVI